jgi:hypothetical protein
LLGGDAGLGRAAACDEQNQEESCRTEPCSV